MEQVGSQSMAIDDFAPRKTHRKSRTGCNNCKQRRVKCDESKPKCRNCMRRNVPCSFYAGHASGTDTPSRPHSATSTSTPQTGNIDSGQPSPVHFHHLESTGLGLSPATPDIHGTTASFDTLDLELLHHFSLRVSLTFAEEPLGLDFWQSEIPFKAFQHAFVLHAVLALSALHLAFSNPERKAACHAKSDFHHSIALPKMIEALSHADEANAEALFMGASILCFHSLAKGPQRGEYLAFSDEGETEWMRLFRGVQSIISQLRVQPFHVFRRGKTDTHHAPGDIVEMTRRPTIAFQEPIAQLRTLLSALAAEDPSTRKYISVLDNLESCSIRAFKFNNADLDARMPTHLTFSWLYQLEEDFLAALQERRPLALVVFAHWLVLFGQLRGKWYLEGWIPHIMRGIYGHLHPQYRDWLRWPAEMLQWTPD